jgi:hypothetical protein
MYLTPHYPSTQAITLVCWILVFGLLLHVVTAAPCSADVAAGQACCCCCGLTAEGGVVGWGWRQSVAVVPSVGPVAAAACFAAAVADLGRSQVGPAVVVGRTDPQQHLLLRVVVMTCCDLGCYVISFKHK